MASVLVFVMRLLLITIFGGLISCSQAEPNAKFEAMLDSTLNGTVPQISAIELSGLLRGEDEILLLDAREQEEFLVSHLKNATWIGFEDFSEERVAEFPRDSNVVIYCSIGRRSEILGERLLELGFRKVRNLRGGMFDWANRDLEMVDSSGKKTEAVHPYSFWWGRWLKSSIERRYHD